MTINEQQNNASFCCEMRRSLMRNLTMRREGIGSTKRKLVKNFAVWELLIEAGYLKKLAIYLQKITETRKN